MWGFMEPRTGADPKLGRGDYFLGDPGVATVDVRRSGRGREDGSSGAVPEPVEGGGASQPVGKAPPFSEKRGLTAIAALVHEVGEVARHGRLADTVLQASDGGGRIVMDKR